MIRRLAHGTKEYLWAVLMDTNGEDLSTATVRLAVAPTGADPVAWQAPDVVEYPAVDTIRAALLVTADQGLNSEYGSQTLWAEVSDHPEVIVLSVGDFYVS